jgi:N-methylhydantoinase B/oxoprolinase/acetone carboxylase alpha subunit
MELPGGGGFGPPEKRDPQASARDVDLGYVSNSGSDADTRGLE